MDTDSTKQYETPQITDHGDLAELTASSTTGTIYDGNYSTGHQLVPDATNP
jgi:hypothetical protein